MKIRNTGYANPYTAVSPAAPASEAERVEEASGAAITRLPDQASVMGIPEAELTPKVRAAIGQLLEEVQNLRLELDQAKRRVDHLEQLADQDTLTPVLNRRAFVRELSRVMAYSERYGAASAVLFFDVDGLKSINDTHGHAAGDAALSHVAAVLMQQVRGSDVVGRLGGDEFGVILAQVDAQGAQSKASQLAEAIESQPVAWNGTSLSVGASVGVHSLVPGQEAQEALEAADRAIYARKHNAN